MPRVDMTRHRGDGGAYNYGVAGKVEIKAIASRDYAAGTGESLATSLNRTPRQAVATSAGIYVVGGVGVGAGLLLNVYLIVGVGFVVALIGLYGLHDEFFDRCNGENPRSLKYVG